MSLWRLCGHDGTTGRALALDGPPILAHWVRLSAGEAVSCQSFLTPRLATALDAADTADEHALAATLSRPERLAAHLRGAQASGAPAAITGHLVGAQLTAARPYWLGQSITLVGPDPATAPRATALAAQGVQVTQPDPDTLLAAAIAALATRVNQS